MFKGLFFGFLTGILVLAGGLVVVSVIAPPPQAPPPAPAEDAPTELSPPAPAAVLPRDEADRPAPGPEVEAPRTGAPPADMAAVPDAPLRDRPAEAPPPGPQPDPAPHAATQPVPDPAVADIAGDAAPRRGDPSEPPVAGISAPTPASDAGLTARAPAAPAGLTRRDRPVDGVGAPLSAPPRQAATTAPAPLAAPGPGAGAPAGQAAAPRPGRVAAPAAPPRSAATVADTAMPSLVAPEPITLPGPAPRIADAEMIPIGAPDRPRRVALSPSPAMPRAGQPRPAEPLPRIAEAHPAHAAPQGGLARPQRLAQEPGGPLVESPPRPAPVPAAEQVRIGRLPSITSGAEPDVAAAPQTDPEDAAEPAAQAAQAPALTRYAADFARAGAEPLFAVILVDDGADPALRARIAELPFPVTVALDPADDGAPEAASSYRAAGHEVMVLAPSDLAVQEPAQRVAHALSRVPEAIGMLDRPPEGSFQGDRLLAQEILPVLQRQGHALMTHDHGLNPAAQMAQSIGLVQGQVFRVLDAADEGTETMRRHLDRAAFRAAQQGGVVVLGHARATTLAALMEWRLQGRAQSVQLAPLSAALTLP